MRRVLAVAGHEARRAVGFLDLRSGLAVLACAALLAASWPVVRDHPLDPDGGLYPVAVQGASPLEPALRADGRFRVEAGDVTDLRSGRVALVVTEGHVLVAEGSARGEAAWAALSEAVARWVDGRMAGEADADAAFPVRVDVVSLPRDELARPAPPQTAPPSASAPPPSVPEAPHVIGATAEDADQRLSLRPAEVEPPFPVRSLLVTFAFLIPMNLVAQLYAGSLLGDRVRHRGLVLLSAPVPAPALVLGRSLPYLGAAVAVVVAAGFGLGLGLQGFAAAFPIVAFVLGCALVVGLLARSEREQTFLLTATTTLFSTFLFLPAVFQALPPVAFLSPVSVVAASADGDAVAWGPFLYAVVPTLLAAAGLGALGAALYREETLFAQRSLWSKAVDGLGRLARRPWSLLAAGAFTVPFALALELFLLALLIPLGLTVLFPAFVVGVAFAEEGLKLAVTAAHVRRGGATAPARAGLWVGSGFFLGEKLALLVALAGFGLLPLGEESLALFGIGGAVLLLAPLALHAGASALSALGTRGGRGRLALAWLGAATLHAGYNAAVLLRGGFA